MTSAKVSAKSAPVYGLNTATKLCGRTVRRKAGKLFKTCVELCADFYIERAADLARDDNRTTVSIHDLTVATGSTADTPSSFVLPPHLSTGVPIVGKVRHAQREFFKTKQEIAKEERAKARKAERAKVSVQEAAAAKSSKESKKAAKKAAKEVAKAISRKKLTKAGAHKGDDDEE